MSKMLGYSFTVEWMAGKKHAIADALLRAPVFVAVDHGDILIRKVMEGVLDPALKELMAHTASDTEYQMIVETLSKCKAKDEIVAIKDFHRDHPAQKYKSQWDDTYGFLTYHNRIIVPKAARKAVLESPHVQHTGQTKTLMNARQLYFWPGMTNDVKLMISMCKECMLYLPSQTLDPQINTTATRPFESVNINLGKQNGKEHLIFADRYSGWTLVRPLKSGSYYNTRGLVPGTWKASQYSVRRRTPILRKIHAMV